MDGDNFRLRDYDYNDMRNLFDETEMSENKLRDIINRSGKCLVCLDGYDGCHVPDVLPALYKQTDEIQSLKSQLKGSEENAVKLSEQLAEKCNHKYILSPIDTELHVRELENKLAEKDRLLQKAVDCIKGIQYEIESDNIRISTLSTLDMRHVLEEIRSSVGGSK